VVNTVQMQYHGFKINQINLFTFLISISGRIKYDWRMSL